MTPGPDRKENRRDKLRRSALSTALPLLVLALLSPPAASQANDPVYLLEIDLLKMSDQLDVRYRWAETGVLPPEYILLGDPEGAVFMYPSFLKPEKEFRKNYTEYDPVSGQLYSFQVPGYQMFSKKAERSGPYFIETGRPMDVEGMKISITSIDHQADDLWKEGLRVVWVDDVKYALSTRKSSRGGRGGLIDINIPISLPKQLEAIFGRGEETRLTVSGREKITIGGTSRWCANCPRTEGMPQQQKFPDLEMEQQLTVNLHGTIGEKINVAIDHSSMGGGAPSTNRIRLNYTGFDDEIIKLIEMGDTDLTLSGAQLISYSGQAKGLFGVKGVAQIGPIDLTVIASKEEGESSSGTFSATGGQSSEISINDYAYIKRQFFYLESPGDDYQAPGFGTIYPVIGGYDSLEVFASLRPDLEWNNFSPKYYIKAWTDPGNTGDLYLGESFAQWFYLLVEGRDYDLIQVYGGESTTPKYLGIRLRQPLGENRALAVRYKMDLGNGDHTVVGDYNYFPPLPDTLVVVPDESTWITAELICPPEDDFLPSSVPGAKYTSTWNMMFRNVYSIGLSGLDDAAINVKIRDRRTVIGTAEINDFSNESYLRIFGLDRYKSTGAWGEDGFVDNRQGVIDFNDGYIMFPSYRPFDITEYELQRYFSESENNISSDPELIASVEALSDTLRRNSSIYNEILDKNSPANEYEIIIEASSGNRVFNLAAFDILDGTEVVMVDGVRLSRGSDYDIDYIGGSVTLKGDYANLPPDASVKIDYQHKPLFGGGKSSLLGIGANLYLSENARINATYLYNSVGAPKYRPRLGEEPTRNMAGDINGSFQFQPGWMTSLANMLPMVNTDAASSLSLTGEIAMSIPNPNTKGEAYIDDMEGVEDSDQINLVRAQWYEASPPISPLDSVTVLPPLPPEKEFFWYNPANTNEQQFLTTSKKDLNPNLDDRENSRQTSMFIKAWEPDLNQWSGIMTGFTGGIDLSTSQYIEIWVNDYTVDQDDRRGVLHIDFGKIDEDFHQPELNRHDNENAINWTNEADTGFVGEKYEDRPFNRDFNEDKFDEVMGVYMWINSRFGNSRADNEDMNGNGRLDESNEYYTIALDLADTAIIDVQRDFSGVTEYWNDPEKGSINRQKSWRMYRLDITKAARMGDLAPRLDKISHMRIWVENIDQVQAITQTDRSPDNMVEITGVKFVGSRWEYNNVRDLANHEVPINPDTLDPAHEGQSGDDKQQGQPFDLHDAISARCRGRDTEPRTIPAVRGRELPSGLFVQVDEAILRGRA